MRTAFETMGTVVSVSLADRAKVLLPEVRARFEEYDGRFSLYRPDSELSRIATRELAMVDSSDSLRGTYERAVRWRNDTNGWFTPNRQDGIVDLNGIVKAEAIEAAGRVLGSLGDEDWTINAGGDILLGMEVDELTGIVDPHDATRMLATVRLPVPRRALATSGMAERGDHIWASAPLEFVQVSVAANSIVEADVLATAVVAGGRNALDDLADRFDVDILAVDAAGELMATPGFRTLIESA